MIERIQELHNEAEEAIAAATTSDALEQARVRFLGRKAELPNMLRGVAQLPPEQRGAVGKAANVARRGLEELIEARGAELGAAELDAHGGEPLRGPLDGPLTILVGAERAGLPQDVVAACDHVARIPIRSESLNAAMAATVALYELTRGTLGSPADAAAADRRMGAA